MVTHKLMIDFMSKVRSRIAEYEKRTSVEFVPVLVGSSSTYSAERAVFGVVGAYLFLLVGLFFFPWSWPWLAASSVGVLAAIWAMSHVPSLFRLMVAKSQRNREVEEAAFRAFISEEVFSTAHRTGVLIFISELEKAVFILADVGLRERVKDHEWRDLAHGLARDFSKKSSGETFLLALDELMKRLEKDFPPSEQNPNELADHVRSPS